MYPGPIKQKLTRAGKIPKAPTTVCYEGGKNGDIIVICDAGGGTVDVISYCIKTVSPLGLEEVTQGTGAACGSILLDVKFLALLKELLGDTEFRQVSCISMQAAMPSWQDNIKSNFMFDEGDDDEFQEIGHLIPLPGVEDKPSIGLEGGFLALDRWSAVAR
ncbi:hypothetical protein ABOM_007934 [Aspergillus bombycis]|uniref:Uncharacterized protein n=1 Tax=Aspergillus bombycis TaxID=109264 RepID=A0A1F7ZSU3_9EURO|nr:hypothetical protein ABOM_007934 [Aspergillus bombycis]OGM42523.1 hypothetical protein ABOM_007934 [Aspergillus bombycis]